MICVAGKCIKCAARIAGNGFASQKYNELIVQLSDGSLMAIGVCDQCSLEPSEFVDCMGAINSAFEVSGGKKIDAKIVGVSGRLGFVDVVRRKQGGRCLGCHQSIEDKWIITNGEMFHENCPMNKEMKEAVLVQSI